MKKLWNKLSSPSKKWALGTLLIIGFAFGALSLQGFHKTLDWTNSEAFCISCHTMGTNNLEFQGSVHDINTTGKRATCSDCHVPEQGVSLLVRKVEAANDLYQHFIGKSIETPEKFEARRGFLAMREWTRMKKSDSLGCRTCHNEDAMDLTLQTPRARTGHVLAKETNQTCIDCHKGISHELPENWVELENELNARFDKK